MKKVVLFYIMNVFIGYSKGTQLSAYSFLKIKGMNKQYVVVPSRVVLSGCPSCVLSPAWYTCKTLLVPSLEVTVSTQGYKLEAAGVFQEPTLLPCAQHTLNVCYVLGALQKLSLYPSKQSHEAGTSPFYLFPHFTDREDWGTAKSDLSELKAQSLNHSAFLCLTLWGPKKAPAASSWSRWLPQSSQAHPARETSMSEADKVGWKDTMGWKTPWAGSVRSWFGLHDLPLPALILASLQRR